MLDAKMVHSDLPCRFWREETDPIESAEYIAWIELQHSGQLHSLAPLNTHAIQSIQRGLNQQIESFWVPAINAILRTQGVKGDAFRVSASPDTHEPLSRDRSSESTESAQHTKSLVASMMSHTSGSTVPRPPGMPSDHPLVLAGVYR